MKSKTSYFKLMGENIRNRSYLAVLSSVGMFLLLPVNVLMNISREKLYSRDIFSWAQTALYKKINGELNLIMLIFIILLGCLCAVSGFSYLHSHVKQDFYHSMPVKRTRWFNVSYFSGLVIFIVPYVFFTLCAVIVGLIYNVMTPLLFMNCMGALLRGVLMFLLIYNTAVLSMTLTGRTGTAAAGGFMLFFYGLIPDFLYTGLGSIFFKTYSHEGGNIILEHISDFCPAALFLRLWDPPVEKASQVRAVSLALILLLTFAFAHLLYRKYPAESAENSLAFKKSAPVIKFGAAVPLSLSVTLFINSVFFGGENAGNLLWWLVVSLISAVIICFAIQFIYDRDIKMMVIKGKISTLLCVLSVAVLILIFKFDVFGFDRYMPKEEDLAKMSLYTPGLDRYFNYNLPADKEGLKTEDFGPIFKLAEEGVKNAALPEAGGEIPCKNSRVTICYVRKDGMSAYRDYIVDDKALVYTLSALCEDEEYKKSLIPILKLDPKRVRDISLADIRLENTQLALDAGKRERLAEAYLKDLLKADIYELAYEPPVAEMAFTYSFPKEKQNTAYGENWPLKAEETAIREVNGLFIYGSYKRTLNLLEQYGCPVRTSLTADEVEYIRYGTCETQDKDTEIFYGDPDMIKMTSDKFNMIKVTDPAQIQTYLDRIDLSDITNGLTGMLKGSAGGGYVEVMFKDGSGPVIYNVK